VRTSNTAGPSSSRRVDAGTFFVHGFDHAVIGGGAPVPDALRTQGVFTAGGRGAVDIRGVRRRLSVSFLRDRHGAFSFSNESEMQENARAV
jgi:hypothetical protein